jgi:hypothetical protein
MSYISVILLFLAAAIVCAVGVTYGLRRTQHRHRVLQRKFGPEYERAIAEYGSAELAQAALTVRAKRVKGFKIRELSPADQTKYTESWRGLQVRFVDQPAEAVLEANKLIKQVMQARGYPVEDFDQRVNDLSVDHPYVVQHYRAACALASANGRVHANTEQLRQAFVHFRALFAELLGDSPVTHPPSLTEAHA